MTLYDLALFLHVVGALGFFAALGLEWLGLSRLRNSVTAQGTRDAVTLFAPLRRVYPASGALLVLSGIYLSIAAWGAVAWVIVSLVLVFLLGFSGPRILGPRLAAIMKAAGGESGPAGPELQRLLREPLIHGAHQVRTGLSLGIVFLMTVKPELGGTLVVVAVSAAVGLLLALPLWSRARSEKAPA